MADSCCGTTIDVQNLQTRQRQVLHVVLGINAATFVLMLATSVQSHSISLLSGGLDNLGDAITYGLSIAVVGASAKAKARVALLKGALILGPSVAVSVQIALRFLHPSVPIFETIGIVGALNLLANLACLTLLTQYRHGDVNMSSAWECSRNDVAEGLAVLVAAAGVWLFEASWPDLVVGSALLLVFLRSAVRIFRNGLVELGAPQRKAALPPSLNIVSTTRDATCCKHDSGCDDPGSR